MTISLLDALTALGNPVVPDEKDKNPQISKFVFPSGILKYGTCFPNLLPSSIKVLIFLNPSSSPSNKKICSLFTPAFSADSASCSQD